MRKERNDFIDFLKGVSIFCVLFAHVSQIELLNKWIYSFHMPIFFFVSGYLFNNKKKNFLEKRFKKIMIPYFVCAIISYLYWVIIEKNLRQQSIDSIEPLKNIFIMKSTTEGYIFNVVLWFLPCLYIIESLFFIMCKVFKNRKKTSIVLSVISLVYNYFFVYKQVVNIANTRLFFCLDCVLMALLFYCIGVLEKEYELLEKIEKKIKSKFISICFFVIGCIITMVLVKKFGTINIMNLSIENFVVFLANPILAIISLKYIHILKKSDIMSKIGKMSLSIMLIHEPFKRILLKLIEIVTNMKVEVIRENPILVLSVVLVLIWIVITINWITKKIKSMLQERIKNENISCSS